MRLPRRRQFLHLAAGKATNCDDCHVGQKSASLGFSSRSLQQNERTETPR
jgi:hypothetical protein